MNQKRFSTIHSIIVVVIIIAAVSYFSFMRETVVEDKLIQEPLIGDSGDTAKPLLIGNNAIYVSSVKPATNIKVGFAVLAGGGYVVIHEDSKGSPGAIIGSSDRLSPGENRGFDIALSRESVDGETFHAMLHSDNGDGIFNAVDDFPVKDSQGNIILMKFQISNRAEEPEAISL